MSRRVAASRSQGVQRVPDGVEPCGVRPFPPDGFGACRFLPAGFGSFVDNPWTLDANRATSWMLDVASRGSLDCWRRVGCGGS